jgi:hypothetical protein
MDEYDNIEVGVSFAFVAPSSSLLEIEIEIYFVYNNTG